MSRSHRVGRITALAVALVAAVAVCAIPAS
jgi:hypothetical protein